MSMSLTELAPELFSCVAANIESLPTLCNLARCSRQLYLFTVPHLYHDVTIHEEARLGVQQDGQLRKVAALLLRRRDLAGLVRHFTLHLVRCPGSTKNSTKFKSSKPSKDSKDSDFKKSEEHVSTKFVNVDQAFKAAISATALSKEEENKLLRQLSDIHKCHHDLILALLLPAMHKVGKLFLDLELGFNRDYPCLEETIRRVACRERPFDIPPPFEALTVFEHSHLFNALSGGFVASLLKLPAIQEISGGFGYVWNRDPGDYRATDKDLTELDSSSSSLTSLDLVAYGLSIADLGHMLRAPKALKTFSYRVHPPACISFNDIRNALRPQENCLESLAFDHFNAGGNESYTRMASFINFKTLKVFKTVAPFLEMTEYGIGRHSLIDIFPPSLETIHLTRISASHTSLLEALEHLLAEKSPQQIPSLKKIILDQAGAAKLKVVKRQGTQETIIMRLSRVAAAQGVSLDLVEQRTDEQSGLEEWEIEEWSE